MGEVDKLSQNTEDKVRSWPMVQGLERFMRRVSDWNKSADERMKDFGDNFEDTRAKMVRPVVEAVEQTGNNLMQAAQNFSENQEPVMKDMEISAKENFPTPLAAIEKVGELFDPTTSSSPVEAIEPQAQAAPTASAGPSPPVTDGR
jgi:hypothetical protein